MVSVKLKLSSMPRQEALEKGLGWSAVHSQPSGASASAAASRSSEEAEAPAVSLLGRGRFPLQQEWGPFSVPWQQSAWACPGQCCHQKALPASAGAFLLLWLVDEQGTCLATAWQWGVLVWQHASLRTCARVVPLDYLLLHCSTVQVAPWKKVKFASDFWRSFVTSCAI